jgi:hypothetical protein
LSLSGSPPSDPQPVASAEAEAFYERAYQRIVRSMLVLPILVFPLLLIKFHLAVALGFVAGSAIAFFNFYWLKRAVVALGDRVTNSTYKQSGSRVVGGFFMRYALIAVGAYVIFKSSAMSGYGLFMGLFVPVGAVLIEAVYETYGALRRGF